jgi:type IX secretion system PorP/SprF family membrane protein
MYLHLVILKNILLFSALMLCFSLHGQDAHWSQFNHNPIYYNPANAGNFENDVRFTANYRDQWRSVTKPFSTIAVAADGNLKKVQNLAVGGNFFHDVAGDGSYRTMQLMGTFARGFALNPNLSLRVGGQLGLNHRSIDYSALTFDSQYQGYIYSNANPTNENFGSGRRTSILFSVGSLAKYRVNKKVGVEVGAGLFNLNRPDQGINGGKQKRDMRFALQSKVEYKINSDVFLLPGFQMNVQGKYKAFIIGSDLRYELLNKEGKYRAVFAGIWTRVKDATWITLGIQYQQTFVGISYDVNYSKLIPASRIRGGLEIAIRHELSIFRPKKITHRVCPDYI